MRPSTIARLGALILLAVIVAGACSAGAPGPSASPTSRPPDAVVTSPPDGGGALPGEPRPQFVVPRPGQVDVHPVGIASLAATVRGRSVSVQAEWWSGVEPCNILDSIQVARNGSSFTVSLFEGHGPQAVACIEIAVLKAAVLSLGELDPGTYTIRPASGDAQPIVVTVS